MNLVAKDQPVQPPHKTGPFDVLLSAGRSETTLQLVGELTFESEPGLVTAFQSIDCRKRPRIVLDFSRVPHANSSGISALIGVVMKAREGGGELVFTGLNPFMHRLFTATGFGRLVQLVQSAVPEEA